MCNSQFLLMDKQKMHMYAQELFEILYSNMHSIAPTGNSFDEDFRQWYSNVIPAMQKAPRQIVLMYVDDVLAGYFQYYINMDSNALMMEEIQIKKEFHGTGLFAEFYQWLVGQLPKDTMYVEAYANKMNFKSQGILLHLGLAKMGENKSGNSYYYKGRYGEILRRYG